MVGEKIVLISGSLYCRRSRYLRYTVFGLAGVLAYFRFRGVRLVSCPETAESAAVEVNARHAALTRGLGHVELNCLRKKSISSLRIDQPDLSVLINHSELIRS